MEPNQRGAEGEATQQQHIYLVVDDWEMGYGIYKIGEDDFDSESRPVVRIQAQHPYSWSFAANGTKILAMQPSEYSPGIPVFDTKTLGVTVCPYSTKDWPLDYRKPVYVSVGGRLLAMVYRSLCVLGPEPLRTETEKPWSWTWGQTATPFPSSLVSCYAVHPDERTVFMSVKGWQPNPDGKDSCYGSRHSTFAFDMDSLQWTLLGGWVLPFTGQAHYDRELDAWVGLCHYEGGVGHVCCCDVPPAAGSETMPAWKLCEDGLFDLDDTHFGATVVYTGDSRFCLIHSRCHRNDDGELNPLRRTVKMTAFVLKYDKEGNLRTTQRRPYASLSYQVAHKLFDISNPVAFCM